MASSEADSRLNLVLVPALEKIIKNASWRKHSKLATECKYVVERLTSATTPLLSSPTSPASPASPSAQSDAETASSHHGVLLELPLLDSDFFLSPLINALSSNYLKVAEPALDAVQKLIAHGYLRGEADPNDGADAKLLSRLIESVYKCHDLGDESVVNQSVPSCKR